MITIGSDYASLSTSRYRLYYGYEVTSHDGEWCFEARTEATTAAIPYSVLHTDASMFDVKSCLLAGIEHLLRNGSMQIDLELELCE